MMVLQTYLDTLYAYSLDFFSFYYCISNVWFSTMEASHEIRRHFPHSFVFWKGKRVEMLFTPIMWILCSECVDHILIYMGDNMPQSKTMLNRQIAQPSNCTRINLFLVYVLAILFGFNPHLNKCSSVWITVCLGWQVSMYFILSLFSWIWLIYDLMKRS